MLYDGAIRGYENSGILGIFQGLLGTPAVALVTVVVASFCFTVIFKAKD